LKTREGKGRIFRALHERDRAFLIPNPWDIGSAKVLAHLGFEALATTSAGFAFTIGRPDYGILREEAMQHIAQIAAATHLPVSADLENGFGDSPQTVAGTICMAAEAGAVGGSIEDATGRAQDPIYSLEFAAERIRAASEAAQALPFPFTLTGRAENYLHSRPDLRDTIRRLQAYQEAGANVLYAPGLTHSEDIAEVVRSVDRPVNLLGGIRGLSLSLDQISALGVKRVSLGSALARAAFGALIRSATELRDQGTFTFLDEVAGSKEMEEIFTR